MLDYTSQITIDGRVVGSNQPPFIIAEVGQNHDGSLGFAHSYIDAVAEAGVDAIKFQTHIASAESSPGEPFRVKFSYEDATRYDYWKRMEFAFEQWLGLKEHANNKGLVFLSSPFSVEAVQLLDRVGMPAWKIGSGELQNPLLFNAIAKTGKPFLLSTGMSTKDEVDKAVKQIKATGNEMAIFQCTSMYPTPLQKVGINVLADYEQYGVPVGLSDHTGTVYPSLMAMARGYHLIEVHVTFDKRMFGPDVTTSLTFNDLRFLRNAADAFYTMQINPVNKNEISEELKEMRQIFGKSLIALCDIPSGLIIKEEMLGARKPCNGILVSQIQSIVGRRLKKDIQAGQLLSWEDFDLEEK